MRNKQYQRFDYDVPANGTLSLVSRTRNDFKFVTGLFFFSHSSLADVKVQLRIDGQEVLPTGTDLELFAWNDAISRNEALWDLYNEEIKASDSPGEIEIDNTGGGAKKISLYLLLENYD